MPTDTYTPIASITLSANTSQVVISDLPQTFRDLILVFNGTVSDFVNVLVSINGDVSSAYQRVQMAGTGSGSGSSSSGTHPGLYMVFGGPSERVYGQLQLMDYSQTDRQKTALSRGHTSSSEVASRGLRWPSNAAVTSLTATAQTGNFLSGSTFNLFGIAA